MNFRRGDESGDAIMVGREAILSRREAISKGAAFALGSGFFLGNEARARQKPEELDRSYVYHCPELVEITAPGPLVRPDGTSECSWSRRPYLDLNLEDAKFWPVRHFQRYRLKKWDMYHMTTPDHYISFLVAWIGYGAFCSAYIYDRHTRSGMDGIHLRLPLPQLDMMRDSSAGITKYLSKKVEATFEVVGERRSLKVDFPEFAGIGLAADLDLYLPQDHDSICGVHLTNPRRMHYGHKINCMSAEGEMRLGDKTYQLDPGDSFGALDFGRGYYPPKLFWYWATASGRDAGGALIGWNLGHGNSLAGTAENAVFYNGRLHKIGVTHCQEPDGDLMGPWRVWTDDRSLELTFIPENVRESELNLGYLYTTGRPALGLFSGHVTLDSGQVIDIRDLFGLFEWVDQRW